MTSEQIKNNLAMLIGFLYVHHENYALIAADAISKIEQLTARNVELVEVVKELLGSIEEYQISLAVATNSSGIKQCPGCEVTARYDRKFPHKSGCILERAAGLVESGG